MKSGKILLALLAVVMLVALTACGGSGSGSLTTAATESVVAEAATASQAIPTADAALTDESVLGNWTDTSDSTRFAKITKADSGYQYEDNEGKYPATFENGVLKVKVGDTDTADVYFDKTSNNLICSYQGALYSFKKSQ